MFFLEATIFRIRLFERFYRYSSVYEMEKEKQNRSFNERFWESIFPVL